MKNQKLLLLPLFCLMSTSCAFGWGFGNNGDCGSEHDMTSSIGFIDSNYRLQEETTVASTAKAVTLSVNVEQDPYAAKPTKYELSSTKALTIFKDSNNNNEIDDEERDGVIELSSSPIELNWPSGTNGSSLANKNMLHLYEDAGTPCIYSTTHNDNWKISITDELEGETEITLHKVTNGTMSDETAKTAKLHVICPEHDIRIEQNELTSFYESTFAVTANEGYVITSVEGATKGNDGKFRYVGLDGKITINYTYGNLKGSFDYTLTLNTHNHTVDENNAVKAGGAMVSSCIGCEAYKTHRLDTTNAVAPFEPSVEKQEDRIGVQYFSVEWDISSVPPGGYDVFVRGSCYESQKELHWKHHVPVTGSVLNAYSLRKGQEEIASCSDLSYGESFGEGTGFRWTTSKIFTLSVAKGDKELALWSNNFNGSLNDFVIHINALLLVPAVQ